ncbi:branched-chain amino acid ABC transporter substrate-binding protein [Frankia sp. R43]|nr:branched-chain amino acid ABC transporter substrate-binding protein [Frankia sp. R43]
MRAPLRVAAVVVAAGTFMSGLAACSSDSSDTGSAPLVAADQVKAGLPTGWSSGGFVPDSAGLRCGQTADDPTRGITDTEITIGGLAYLTSANGSSMAGSELGAQARFDRANADGGINGRKIHYVGTLDDGNDPARNIVQAKALVEREKIFAAVPVMTTSANYLDTFCEETVPFFGWGTNQGYCGTSIGFGITGCSLPDEKLGYTLTTYGPLFQAMFDGKAKGRSIALIGIDNDSARDGLAAVSRSISAVGLDVVYEENPIPPSGATDTTAIVNAIMGANDGAPPDVVYYIADFNSTIKLTAALAAAGFQGKNLNPVGYDPRLAGFEGLQSSYTVLLWQPGVDTSVPAIRQMVDDFGKYAPGTAISLPAMAGYWAADMFVTAVTKAGRDLTIDSLLKLLNNDYSNYVEGALPETRWPTNHYIQAPCGSLVQMNGDTYDIVSDVACGALVKE